MPSEREKMLVGELYLATDPELVEMRNSARHLLARYNSTVPEAEDERRKLLGELFGSLAGQVEVEPPFFCDYGFNIRAGDGLYLNTGCVILDCRLVEFGHGVLCGPRVQIYTATHPTEPGLRRQGLESALPVQIGDNVWIGGGVIVCPGVTIGSNTTIGAGSVVTRDIPPGVIAVGNPCRVLREVGEPGAG